MAKMEGITGKLSGKMGSAVFRVREGQQIVAQYNPIVKNPNTQGQQNTRAAFKLLSQLGAILDAGIGTMGVTKRASRQGRNPRNGFFSKNYPLVEIDETNGAVAKIPMEQIQLTDSFKPFGEIDVVGVSNTITVTIALNTGSTVKTGKIALVGYSTAGVIKTPMLVALVDVPVDGQSIRHAFEDLPQGDYTVLSYGIIPLTEGAKKIDLDNIHTPSDEDFIAAVDLRALTSAGDTAETVTVGANYTLAE